MKANSNTYTVLLAGGTFPHYSDYSLATKLGFKLTYTSSSLGRLYGAELHLPSGWKAKLDPNCDAISSKTYFACDEHDYVRALINYKNCEISENSHIVKRENYLNVTFITRLDIYVQAYSLGYKIELADRGTNSLYSVPFYYSNYGKCEKKCAQQKVLLRKCLSKIDEPASYWDIDFDILDSFFKLSNYQWEKIN